MAQRRGLEKGVEVDDVELDRLQSRQLLADRIGGLLQERIDPLVAEPGGEEDPREQRVLVQAGLERTGQPGVELRPALRRQAVHPSIGSPRLDDDPRRDRTIGLQTVQSAVDLGLVGMPEVDDGAGEGAAEIVAALRPMRQQPENGVPEFHVATVAEGRPGSRAAAGAGLRGREPPPPGEVGPGQPAGTTAPGRA